VSRALSSTQVNTSVNDAGPLEYVLSAAASSKCLLVHICRIDGFGVERTFQSAVGTSIEEPYADDNA
jgi:hypothetical protein